MGTDLTPQGRLRDLRTLLTSEAVASQLKLVLPKHLTADRMVRIALSAASRNPLLLSCTPQSIGVALMKAAEFGLEVDGWDAHLVPFKNRTVQPNVYEATLIVDYKGYCKLAYQSEIVHEIQAAAVHEKDDFSFKLGTGAFVDHTPTDEEDPGPLTHAWALARVANGGCPFVVLNRRQVMARRKMSKARTGPWTNADQEPSMWTKTAVRELAKFIPRSSRMQTLLKHEEADDLGGKVLDGVLAIPDARPTDELAAKLEGSPADDTPPPDQQTVDAAREAAREGRGGTIDETVQDPPVTEGNETEGQLMAEQYRVAIDSEDTGKAVDMLVKQAQEPATAIILGEGGVSSVMAQGKRRKNEIKRRESSE